MNAAKVIGIILIILGVLGFIYKGVSYTTKETVVDVGPLEVQAEKEKTVPIPEILSGVAIVAGIGLLVVGNKRT
jgi:hypothetical protein